MTLAWAVSWLYGSNYEPLQVDPELYVKWGDE